MQKTLNSNVLRGGAFLIASTPPEDVFTFENLNEEDRLVYQMVTDFIETQVRAEPETIESQPKLLEAAGELGLLGAHIPEEYGGLLMSTNTVTAIYDSMGKAGGSFTTSYAAHTGIGMLPILYFGTEEQKLKFLPGLASGELKASYCLTEPNAGSDALAAKSKAILTEDGKHYILNGQKMWISNAGFADILIVFAKIDGEQFTGFIVEAKSEGISLGAEEKKMGIKASSTRQVFFENVKVPAENILGQAGKGHLIAFNVLNVGRFKLGVLCGGGSREIVEKSVQYANERHQFKVPISSFGAIKNKLADQAINTFALLSANYRVSNLLQEKKGEFMEAGKSYSDAMLEAAQEYAIECAILKVLGSEVLDFNVDEMVQIHGGNGFSEEFPAAKSYRDARINKIYEGTNEINRLLMVNQLLKKAMKGDLNLTDPAWAVQKELASIPKMETTNEPFGQETKAVDDFKKIFLLVSGSAVKMQMEGQLNLKHEQEILMNMADMMISIFSVESTLLRVKRIKEPVNEISPEIYQNLLKALVFDSQEKIAQIAKTAIVSFAEGELQKILLMGVKRFSAYPPVNVKNLKRSVADTMIEKNTFCF